MLFSKREKYYSETATLVPESAFGQTTLMMIEERSYVYIETKNKKIPVLNHRKNFKQPVKISAPYYK